MGTRKNPTKHGFTHTRIYAIYRGIKARCYSKANYHYKWYGARGITMCDEWLKDPGAFCKWGLANGYQDDLTIERIDNNKNYSPDNCRWATITEQCNNRRNNRVITINGITQTEAQWARQYGLHHKVITRRLKKGLSGEALIQPPAYKPIHKKIAQIDLKTNKTVKIWDSPIQIYRTLGFSRNSISNCCKHKPTFKTAYGYKWEYVD